MMPPIAIIGGGPSGLAFARLLQISNIDFVVYERNVSAESNPEQQGGSLDIHASTGQVVLSQAGLMAEFEKYARRASHAAVIVDKAGNELLAFGNTDKPEIDRAQLRGLLLESVSADKVQWNKEVKIVNRNETGEVVISFTDGTTASGFKLVVGADGTWSRVRHLVTLAKPVYSGKHYLESRISTSNPFHSTLKAKIGSGALIAVGSFKHLAVMAMSDGSYRTYIALSVAEDFFTTSSSVIDLASEDGAVARRQFVSQEEYFAGWASHLKDIITHCEGPFRRWPLYHMPVESLNWKHASGVALLGDAAHVSTPFVGEGVNCALFDALELATRIIEHGTDADSLLRAVSEYEKSMFERGIRLIGKSNESATLLFAEDPIELLKVIHSPSKE